MSFSLSLRYRMVVLAVFAASLPLVIYGAQKARQSNSNRVQDWLPEHLDETKSLYWFAEHFGSDELLMISWDGCDLDDPRLIRFAERLRRPAEQGEAEGAPLFRAVFTGPEAMRRLTDLPLELSYADARRRLSGWLIGRDGKTTCAVALISEQAFVSRRAAVEYVFAAADEIDGLSRDSIYVAGSTIESVAIDDASSHRLGLMMAVSLLLCVSVMYFCLRRVALVLMVFAAAIFSQHLSMALMHFTGSQMDSIALMVPTLVYVLSISAGVHLVNYYRDAIDEGGLRQAATRAVRYAWTPCLLAAGTTALGLVSLTVSQLTPIRRFGMYSALGVMCGLGVLFLLLPVLLQQFPQRGYARGRDGGDGSDGDDSEPRPIRLLSDLAIRYHGWVVAVGGLLLLAAGWGVIKIQVTARLHDLFYPDARVIQDYAWLEEHIGPLVPVEVVVRVPKPVDATFLDRMRLVAHVQDSVLSVDGVGSANSAISYAPPLSGTIGGGWWQVARRTVVNRQLEKHQSDFVKHRYLYQADDEELWRISARANASSGVDYGRLLDRVRKQVNADLPGRAAELGIADASVVYSGSIPLVHKAQDQLLTDLIKSFVVAFAVIAAAMIVLLRSVRAGMLSMIPNVLPSIVVFGYMGWAEVPIEVGSMMTASAALGIAVDDTLHFITWFRRGLARGDSRPEAIRFAYRRCATAMIQTSLICSLGLLVFAFSAFVPIARFAWLMAAMLGAAIVGDLIVLPAILAGRLGSVFEPPK